MLRVQSSWLLKPGPIVTSSGCLASFRTAVGVAHPISIMVETFGTERVPTARIEELIDKHFDLRPGAILKSLDLRRPIYRKTATYGHFGRDDHDFTWEKTDKADALREAAGIDNPANEREAIS